MKERVIKSLIILSAILATSSSLKSSEGSLLTLL